MVVQWEDRFHASNRAHTYLGPIDNPEAIGKGDGLGPKNRYPDFVTIARGFGCGAGTVKEKSQAGRRLARNDRLRRPLRARRRGAVSRARAADDPLGQDGEGFDQVVIAGIEEPLLASAGKRADRRR